MDEAPSTSRVRRHRASLSQEQKDAARERNRLQKTASRQSQQTPRKTRKNNSQFLADARQRETEQQTLQRRQSERIRAQINRSTETPMHRNLRRHGDVQRHRQSRIIQISAVVNELETVEEFYCGSMDKVCPHCQARYFSGEATVKDKVFTHCCQRGNVKLPELKKSPLMELLFSGSHPHSKNFKENIRSFNSSMAFASVGATMASPPGTGPYCFRIHGQIYHRAGTLHPENGVQRKYAQLYILDPEEAARQRGMMGENNACCGQLMTELSEYMALNNPFAQSAKMLYEVEQEAINEATFNNRPMPNIFMAIKTNRTVDIRRYNEQKSNEVAVVFEADDGEPPLERDLIIHLRSLDPNQRKMQRVSVLDPCLEPMTYPLIFPFGDSGWSPNLKHVRGPFKTVTQMEYYSYRFSVRNGEIFNPYLAGGRLTQQFFVDAYVKMESNRLNYIKLNQAKLRTELYSTLADHLNCEAEGLAGRAIILPSSFLGSPRNMQQNYQDAMAIVRKNGKPDYFITMTCNPKWKEITENLLPNETASDRPDLVARVFNLKAKALLKDLENGILGRQLAKVHVVEFQKRGLPHIHILLILGDENKPTTPEIVDKFVSAEIPDKEVNPRLYDLVTRHMIHGPCGSLNPNSLCMDKTKCSKDFPKQFCNETQLNVGGYPKYKRRNNGATATVGKKTIDNRWVVPYNKYLLEKYNCHINVEVCATIKSVKYLFKYVYKGHDAANIELREQNVDTAGQHNEVKSFVDSRYVSAPEAAWRIFSYKMHDQTHTVSRLQVHLPEKQSVVFHPDRIQQAVERAARNETTLTAYFKLNQIDAEARNFFYHEIPENYVFKDINATENKGRKQNNEALLPTNIQWVKRQRGGEKVIGRMYTVSMSVDMERYCLRLLLLHVKGATSFEDLKTINGVAHERFEEAADALGLLENEEVWEQTVADAAATQMPKQVREVFATVCVFSTMTRACRRNLFHKYIEELCQDFVHRNRHPSTCAHCINLALLDLQEFFLGHNKTCDDFGLPEPVVPVDNDHDNDKTQDKVKSAEMYISLNDEQLAVFEEIYKATLDMCSGPKCFFLDGPGGSGKTYLYETLIHTMRGETKKVLAVASTGVAANLLPHGRTYHSQYGVPVPLTEASVSYIKSNTKEAEVIRDAKLLIWDESTMASSKALNLIDQLLREIMNPTKDPNKDIPFGGKVLLLGGDFRQTLPIVRHGSKSAIVESCIKKNQYWNIFKKLSLKTNVRSVDPEYSKWLIKLGDGDLMNSDNLEDEIVEIPAEMIINGSVADEIFGTDTLSFEKVLEYSTRAILCPKNEDANAINLQVLAKVEGDEVTSYLSVDTMEDETQQDAVFYPTEFLNGLNPSGMPPHELRLKKGAIVMLLRNLNTKRGLCNGTRIIVTDLKPNLIIGQVLTGSAKGNIVFIPRITLIPSDGDLPFKLRRRQFPVSLAFAMTINKSQGQTLDQVGIYLPEPVFGHGQLYVAFSRVKRSSDVKVRILSVPGQGNLLGDGKIFTTNVVFKEIL